MVIAMRITVFAHSADALLFRFVVDAYTYEIRAIQFPATFGVWGD